MVGSHTDHVAVMYAGRMVEIGAADGGLRAADDALHAAPCWTRCPNADPAGHELPQPIPGTPPNLLAPPPGCPFSPRCAFAEDDCRETRPELSPVADQPGHSYACLHPAGPVAVGAAGGRGRAMSAAAIAVAAGAGAARRLGHLREPGGGATRWSPTSR